MEDTTENRGYREAILDKEDRRVMRKRLGRSTVEVVEEKDVNNYAERREVAGN